MTSELPAVTTSVAPQTVWTEEVHWLDRIPRSVAMLLLLCIFVGVWQAVYTLRLISPIIMPSPFETVTDIVTVALNLLTGDRLLNAGVVLVGGGALLPGMAEVAEQVFDVPVRIGSPGGVAGLADPTIGPQYAAAIGLALFGARYRPKQTRPAAAMPVGAFAPFRKVKQWFAGVF